MTDPIPSDDENVTEHTAGNADPDAPYGRRADGTPKRKPGPSKGTPRGASTPAAPRPTRKTPNRAARAASAAPDYRAGIAGLLQIPAFILSIAGRFDPTFSYDAAAVVVHTPNIAEAVNAFAQEEPRAAALLEKVLAVGPYGALIGVAVPLIAQIAVNHRKVPVEAVEAMGAVTPEKLMESLAAG